MKKFEYEISTIKKDENFCDIVKKLNKFGEEGWELIQLIERDIWYICSFKREREKEKYKLLD